MAEDRVKVVLAGAAMARYPQAGGHWSVYLQYLHGLDDLGHDLFWVELLESSGDEGSDSRTIAAFLRRFAGWGFEKRCAVLLWSGAPTWDNTTVHGVERHEFERIAREADILWNFHCSMREPLLSLFRRKALIDLDPGHLHVSALSWDMGIDEHDVFFTVGTNLQHPECDAPTFGKVWHPFLPPLHLPMWQATSDPGAEAPVTSVTHWTWGDAEQLWLGDRLLSPSKRDAYLRFLELPRRCRVPFELAIYLHPRDRTGDRELLRSRGWRLVHPYRVARTIAAYQRYIQRSRAEFGCPKPVHTELKTGWFSDRSAAYLASGRPVALGETGYSRHLPTGRGLLAFADIDQAQACIERILSDYRTHQRAAREIASEFMDARKVIPAMLDRCW